MKAGERYRVKATPWARKHGVAVHGAEGLASKDYHVWPGEIGIVVERTWSWENAMGEKGTSSGLWLEFSRGRSTTCPLRNPEDFLKVKG